MPRVTLEWSPMSIRRAFFVDESGQFDNTSDTVAVAGLLLRDSPALQPHILTATLKRALPSLPWPLHAAFINQPAYLALATEAEQGSRLSATAESACSTLKLAEP